MSHQSNRSAREFDYWSEDPTTLKVVCYVTIGVVALPITIVTFLTCFVVEKVVYNPIKHLLKKRNNNKTQ
jgi:hypothetical protein